MNGSASEVTELLHAWSEGDAEALERLLPLLYDELRRRAASALGRESPGVALQPTELVHEAYLRLVDQRRAAWRNRAQFLALASEMMRRILVDRARARRAGRRSGGWARVSLERVAAVDGPLAVDVLDLDAALSRLAAFDERKSRITVLRFFGGLTLRETAETLGLSIATVERDWQVARAWLFDALSDGPADDDAIAPRDGS